MAYKADLVVTVTQYFYDGKLLPVKEPKNHLVITQTRELMRCTFSGKNMNATLDTIMEYRRSPEFPYDLSIALSEFGINSNDKEYYRLHIWNEKTPK